MKILIVSQYYYPENFRINDIAEEFAARGHKVQVVTGLPDYAASVVPKEYKWRKKRNEVINGVSIHRVPIIARRKGVFFRFLNYTSFAMSSWLYAHFGKRFDADAIFVYQTSPVFQATAAFAYRKRLKAPVTLYCCDLWPESLKAWGVGESNPAFKITKKMSAAIYRACNWVCVSSRPFAAYLSSVCGVSVDKISYLPQHAVDFYAQIMGEYEENSCIDFLFAGNIGSVQNVDCILKAVSKMDASLPFLVHIVGDGSELESCKNLAGQLGVAEKVVFHGRYPQEEMKRFYRMADCFLLTLRGGDFIGKTLPAKSQDYLSVGKPVVAAADEAVQEMVKEANCGAAVPAGDAAALAKAMEDVISHFEYYREMGVNGRRFYEENYTKKVYMDRLTKLLGGMK